MTIRIASRQRSRWPWWKRFAAVGAAAVGVAAVTLIVNSDRMIGLWESFFLDPSVRIAVNKVSFTTVGVAGPVLKPTVEEYLVHINFRVLLKKRRRETICSYNFLGTDQYASVYIEDEIYAPKFRIEAGRAASDETLSINRLPIPTSDVAVAFRVECDGVTSNSIAFTIPRK